MQSHNVRRNVIDLSSVIALLFVCGYLAGWRAGCVRLTPGAVTMATRALKFGMGTPLVII